MVNNNFAKINAYEANLFLGGTSRNLTPQISVTHPTSRQHRTHIKIKKSFQIIYQKVTQVM